MTWRSVPLTPRRLGLRVTPGPNATAAAVIYRPFSRIRRLALGPALALARRGIGPACRAPLPRARVIPDALGHRGAGLAAMRSHVAGRWTLGVAANGELVAVAKAGQPNDSGIEREAAALRDLAAAEKTFEVPAILGAPRISGTVLLAMAPVVGEPQLISFERAADLALAIAATGRVHRDLTPWNILVDSERTTVVDWEESEPGADPLADYAHFVVQTSALLVKQRPELAAAQLTAEGSPGIRVWQAGEQDASPAAAYRAAMSRLAPAESAAAQRYHRAMAAAL